MTIEENTKVDDLALDQALKSWIKEKENAISDQSDFFEYTTNEDYPHPNSVWSTTNTVTKEL